MKIQTTLEIEKTDLKIGTKVYGGVLAHEESGMEVDVTAQLEISDSGDDLSVDTYIDFCFLVPKQDSNETIIMEGCLPPLILNKTLRP